MKMAGGFASVDTSAIICAGLLLAACSSMSSSGLSSHQDASRADSAGETVHSTGGSGSTGSGGSIGTGGMSGSGGVMGSGASTARGGGSGAGGAPNSGGNAASGGVTGKGGLAGGGAIGSGGGSGTGGRTGSGGAPGSGGSPGLGGTPGSGGRIGSGGTGSGGTPGTGGMATRDAAQDGNLECGPRTCAAGEYCCSASCGLCAPMGAMCVAISCLPDGGFGIDASACRAVPAADTLTCGGTSTPHAYVCVLATLPAPCVLRNVGNVADTYCCP
jgi:hypothetical protein